MKRTATIKTRERRVPHVTHRTMSYTMKFHRTPPVRTHSQYNRNPKASWETCDGTASEKMMHDDVLLFRKSEHVTINTPTERVGPLRLTDTCHESLAQPYGRALSARKVRSTLKLRTLSILAAFHLGGLVGCRCLVSCTCP